MKIENDKILIEFIEKALGKKQSPKSISGRLKKEFNIKISYTSIYKWIYFSSAQRNARYLCFRRYNKKKQRRNKTRREMVPELVSIDLRPKKGIHWEGKKTNCFVFFPILNEVKEFFIFWTNMRNRKIGDSERVCLFLLPN